MLKALARKAGLKKLIFMDFYRMDLAQPHKTALPSIISLFNSHIFVIGMWQRSSKCRIIPSILLYFIFILLVFHPSFLNNQNFTCLFTVLKVSRICAF